MTGPALILDLQKASAGYKEDVSSAKKKYAVKKYGNTTFADPENKKYPVGDKRHANAAWHYVNVGKNAAKYTSSKLASVKSRIKAAVRRFGGHTASDMKKALEQLDVLAKAAASKAVQSDNVTLDVPLLLKLMEFSREEAGDDEALHRVVERLISRLKSGKVANMDDFSAITSEAENSSEKLEKSLDEEFPVLSYEELLPEEREIVESFEDDDLLDEAPDEEAEEFLGFIEEDLEKALTTAEKKVKPWRNAKGARKISTAFKDWKAGKMHSGSKKGPIVKDHKQAIAIALSQGREAMKKAVGELFWVDFNEDGTIIPLDHAPLKKAWSLSAEQSGGSLARRARGARAGGNTPTGTRGANTSMHKLGSEVNQRNVASSGSSGLVHSFNRQNGHHTFANERGSARTVARVTGPNTVHVMKGAHINVGTGHDQNKAAVTTASQFHGAVRQHMSSNESSRAAKAGQGGGRVSSGGGETTGGHKRPKGVSPSGAARGRVV